MLEPLHAEHRYPPLAGNVRQASVLYWEWVKGVPSGRSFGNVCGAPVTQDLGQALSHTGALLAMTLVMVLVLSLLFGVLAAARAGSGLDLAFRGFSYAAWAIPPFLLALVVQSVLIWLRSHAGFRLFPASGWPGSCGSAFFTCSAPQPLTFHYVGAVLRFLVVPSLALAVAFVGLHSRYLRSALLVALAAPYTTTARAKGLSERRVVLRHALRNSLGTFTSVLLLDFGAVARRGARRRLRLPHGRGRPALPRRDRGDRQPERRRAEVPRPVRGPGAADA